MQGGCPLAIDEPHPTSPCMADQAAGAAATQVPGRLPGRACPRHLWRGVFPAGGMHGRRAYSMPVSHPHLRLRKCCRRRRGPNLCATAHSPQVRAAYIDKVSAKVLDLFRNYWAVIDRLEVGRCVGIIACCICPGVGDAGGRRAAPHCFPNPPCAPLRAPSAAV